MKRRPKILLVDDDPDFVEATKLILETKPYQVLTAVNGDDGLRKAKQEKPDIIILDVIMPTKDGFMVCEHLKKDAELSRIPVIMLTSLVQRMGEVSISRIDAMKMQAEDYIDKPVKPEELLARVDKWLKEVGF